VPDISQGSECSDASRRDEIVNGDFVVRISVVSVGESISSRAQQLLWLIPSPSPPKKIKSQHRTYSEIFRFDFRIRCLRPHLIQRSCPHIAAVSSELSTVLQHLVDEPCRCVFGVGVFRLRPSSRLCQRALYCSYTAAVRSASMCGLTNIGTAELLPDC